MGIPVRIRTYKHSFLANVISIFGTLVDGLCKLMALALFVGAISEGLFPGILLGVIAFVVCVAIGTVAQALCDKLAKFLVLKKLEKLQNK